jgi:hypothetical protein
MGLLGAAWPLGVRTPRADLRTGSADPEDPVDTLNVWRALRRNRRVVAGVLVAMALGTAWALMIRPMTYQTTSTVVVVPPPPRPTDVQLLEHPEWQGLDSDNPYARLYDPATISATLSYPISSPAGRDAIRERTGSSDFDIEQVYRYGFATPFVTVVSQGSSPEQALATNRLVIEQMRARLDEIQRKEPTSERYFITLEIASGATKDSTRMLEPFRPLLIVLGGGVVALFLGIGVSDAIRISRRQRSATTPAPQPETSHG